MSTPTWLVTHTFVPLTTYPDPGLDQVCGVQMGNKQESRLLQASLEDEGRGLLNFMGDLGLAPNHPDKSQNGWDVLACTLSTEAHSNR